MKNKYFNQHCDMDGYHFPSKAEMWRYHDLKLLQRNGEIENLQLQVEFKLAIGGVPIVFPKSKRQARYIADFVYKDIESGKQIIEDKKGKRTDVYKLKHAIMHAMGYVIYET